MIYVISDLHGYPLDAFQDLLKKAGFSDNDFLYILGDVIDRNGDGGISMLLWLLEQPNIQLLLGNHEAMLLSCEFVFETIESENLQALTPEKLQILNTYMQNGGDVTLRALSALYKTAPGSVRAILDYLHDAPLYDAVSAGKHDFLLVHAGLRRFAKTKKLSQYTPDDLLWTSPQLTDAYFDDVITIFGHTPTSFYGDQYAGRIVQTKTWIAIDVGAAFGRKPVLLRLDDLREFSA